MPKGERGPLVECVPNFSEGRESSVIDAIARAISSVPGVGLLGVEPGADANRTVYTFAGEPEAVAEAALASARTAFGLIDMARHSGVHPRMGALDVCPFVPLSGLGMEGCVELSRRVAERIATELGVPVYLYEEAASRPERRSLAYLRSGGYEALPAKLASPEWKPDFGPASFVPRWGAAVVGARPFLIAFNVNLGSRDAALAKEIAGRVRESGRGARDAEGRPIKGPPGENLRVPGRLKALRAIGWYIDSYGCAQVSMNILDYRACPLHAAFEAVAEEAAALGCGLAGSEIIGLVPLEAMLRAGEHFLLKEGEGSRSAAAPAAPAAVLGTAPIMTAAPAPSAAPADERLLLETALRAMGLDAVAPFRIEDKIVEFALASASRREKPGL